jgi:aminopeptidase N
MRRLLPGVLLVASTAIAAGQQPKFSHADSLRGMNSPQRSWWDVTFYDLHVAISPSDSTIRGSNAISYRVLRPSNEMQIDLQVPMMVDSMVQDGKQLTFKRDSNAFFVTLAATQPRGSVKTISVYYHGRPRLAKRPPWDGGFGWGVDSLNRPYFSTTDEGLGASVYWPNKDIPREEPDSQWIAVTVPDPIIDVSNGRLRKKTSNGDGTTTYEWFVTSPINNYDVAVNAGTYEHFADTLAGEKGKLSMDFWPLSYHLEAAKKQFAQAKTMLTCFEKWYGPYPWYADGYKLVETAHLGMEHQSAVAYGNRYLNGYLGRDRSATGLGTTWDFIIVHESAHEWWGNNISAEDHADMWIHEAFATYAEGIYQECLTNRADGEKYLVGARRNIQHDSPVVGVFGVNAEGSGDMYNKGAAMLQTMRQIINNDARWRSILRGLQSTFGRRTINGHQLEQYINTQSGINFDKVYAQYLMTTRVPNLEWDIQDGILSYRWSNVVPGFDMPVRVHINEGPDALLRPSEDWKQMPVAVSDANFRVDDRFYVKPVRVIR